MTNKLQEHALAILRKAKKNGALDATVRAGLAELTEEETRPEVKEVLETPVDDEGEKSRELTPEQQSELLSTLEARFAKKPEHYRRPKGIDFAEVKVALETNPELMYSLAKMEETGGVPDIIDDSNFFFVFGDCSAESPDRRNLTHDQAAEMAKQFGVDMMPALTYIRLYESHKFDRESGSWLMTHTDIRDAGKAFAGKQNKYESHISTLDASYSWPEMGWRGILVVPKV